jgi:lysozyme
MSPNALAFLALISHSEGTDRVFDSYRVCYGFKHTIVDFRDHPAVTGEWHGESLDSLGGKYVGEVSTAAGRYQIRKETWLEAKAALKLNDFTPASQDAAALWLIRGKGALAAIEAGDVPTAIAACRNVWASLPGGTSGQPEAKLAQLLTAYRSAGGALA